MWIFENNAAINTDQCLSIGIDGSRVNFLLAGVHTVTNIDCGTEDRAKYIYKDIISELGKGTLIFNVDRRLGK